MHTHCNTGALACLGWGTALGVIRALRDRGALAHVIADETRPLLQGSRLTAWELGQLGIEHYLASDGAGPFLISQGQADAVVVGADRVAANGDVANKIGTYSLALAARRAGIPFVVADPESTIDEATASGDGHPARAAGGRGGHLLPRRPGRARGHPRAQLRLRRDPGRAGHRDRDREPADLPRRTPRLSRLTQAPGRVPVLPCVVP